MSRNKISIAVVTPVLLSFFVMSFIDLVGTGVDELKQDSEIPVYILQLIPFVAFIWFFLLSVPIGVLQDKIGKKRALNIGILITAIGLIFPVLGNTLPVILTAFALLGIGNTILQVSANPLMVDVVPENRASSFLSLSQFVKSLGSMVGPFVAGMMGPWLARLLGDESAGSWRYGLYFFALISIISWIWLSSVKIEETLSTKERASVKSCFMLLRNRFVLMMVIGIFVVVGIDVAINSNIGTFLSVKLGVGEASAKYAKSLYFLAKMTGTLTGSILLTRWSSRYFLIGSSLLASLAILILAFTPSVLAAWIIIFIISLGISNIFPLIFSITVRSLPSRSNEISGLMIMAVSGGAVVPFLVGYAMNLHFNGGIFVLLACALYLLFIALFSKADTSKET
ncbi:MAG TPA: MFS transporter [Bacteroidaceae bacterium]|nr:MFS transporter [Bacteroidaceae bacterium]